MHPFHYLRPNSMEMAVEALAAHPGAAIMSGGQSLVLDMRSGVRRPEAVIDISRLPGLSQIACDRVVLSIGALCTHHAVATSPMLTSVLPGLARLAGCIADPAIRRRGTIGGALVQNDPLGDYPPTLVALAATIDTTDGAHPADALCGAGTGLSTRGIVTGIRIPVPQAFAYAKFRIPASGSALAGVAVARDGDAVRVAVAGTSARGAFRWTEAEQRLSSRFHADALTDLHLSSAGLVDNIHGSADYRAHLVRVMLERAMTACIAGRALWRNQTGTVQTSWGYQHATSGANSSTGGRDGGIGL